MEPGPHPLPYAPDALEPWLPAATLRAHAAHHRRCQAAAERLLAESPLAGRPLEQVIVGAGTGALLDNAAESWNHAFFWRSVTPGGGPLPAGPLADAIDASFGSLDGLRRRFEELALRLFGVGWAWLVRTGPGIVEVQVTRDAVNPLVHGRIALLGCDLWEHAYFADYGDDRTRYLDGFWAAVDWGFAAGRFSGTAAPIA